MERLSSPFQIKIVKLLIPVVAVLTACQSSSESSGSNQAPSVSAGPDQSITLPAAVTLDGMVSDDGLPNPPGAVMTMWSQIDGPGTVTFGNAAAVDSTASFSAPGTYRLRLIADDEALQSSDDISVTVNAAPPSAAIVEATPTSVIPHGVVTVTVSDGPGSNTDWVGLYVTGSPDDGASLIDRQYLNGLQTPPITGLTTATLMFAMPTTVGEYEFRFFPDDGFSPRLATSPTVAVAASSDPSQVGQWTLPFTTPVVAVHMMLLNTGKVLMWDDNIHLWNPATGAFSLVSPNSLLFCAGQTTLADGRVLAVGGHPQGIGGNVGITDVNIFDTSTESWTLATPMNFQRWYPTATALQDGRVLVVSGSTTCAARPIKTNPYTPVPECVADIPEIYNPATDTWTSLTNASLGIPLYPLMFLLPDARVLYAGSIESDTSTQVLDIEAQTWTTVDGIGSGGSAAMFRPGKIIKAGSAALPFTSPALSAVNTAYVLDMNQPSPSWRAVGSMALPRAYHTLTLLPDGNVIVTGGTQTTEHVDTSQAVLEAEMWNVETETWSTMASRQIPRSYHGTALLLPDGRVLVSGSGQGGGPNQFNAELFSPPYLFKGPRPSITSAPQTVQYGSAFFVGTADTDIELVSLIRLGAVTHGFDSSQLYVDLTIQQAVGGLDIQAPASANLAPPGDYMLFIVNTNGVPSVASFVNIPAP